MRPPSYFESAANNATSASTNGLTRALSHTAAVVTTLSLGVSGFSITLSGASFFIEAGTSATP
ncbi:hypothetical protein D3C80_2043370 [compost metagenome]